MGIKRLIGRGHLGGGRLIERHIANAISKKRTMGKPIRECLEESLRESSEEEPEYPNKIKE